MDKLKIWRENIPYNSAASKLDIMEIHEEYTMQDIFQNHPGIFDLTKDYIDDMSGNDTLVYKEEIVPGLAKETFEDEPYLIPYIVEGSKKCFIVCPGGGYLTKSMDNEGEDVAKFLNEAGISCFVLWYRSYPYKYPVMFRDCQRAIRYVRFHCDEYGIDSEKIGILGFSAGGNLAATTVEIFRDSKIEELGFIEDEVDKTSAHVSAMGLIYPALSFDKSKSLLFGVFDKNDLKTEEMRSEIASKMTIKNHIKEGDAPIFLCSAIDDILIPSSEISNFAIEINKKKIPFEVHMYSKGGHGYGGCNPMRANPMFPADYERVEEWKKTFIGWVNSVLK